MSNKKTHNASINNVSSEEDILEIAKYIAGRLYGKQAEMLLDYLAKNEYIAEEKISDSIDMRSNEARKILQKLSDEAIVVPDKVRAGEELLHVWRLNRYALKTFVLNRLKKTREKLELLLKREFEIMVYECKSCKRRFLLDEAYTYNFQCPYDNDILVEARNPNSENTVRNLVEKLETLISIIERVKSA